jgi:hypothetical protein
MSPRIAIAVFVMMAASANAGQSWTAVPIQPSSMNRFVGNTVAWVCADAGCSSVTDTGQAIAMSECKAVARQVGKLASFSTSKGPFTDARLADCNEAARGAKAP